MSKSIILVGLVSALILCGGAAAVIALNDTNNNASDVSDAYSSSTADSLFIKSSDASYFYEDTSSDLVLKSEAKKLAAFDASYRALQGAVVANGVAKTALQL